MKLMCKEASQLLSQAYEQRLPWREQMRLRYHLMICKNCRQVSAQFSTIRLVGQRFRQNVGTGSQQNHL